MSVEFTRESWDLHVRATAVPDRLCALDLTIASAAAFSGFSSFKDAKDELRRSLPLVDFNRVCTLCDQHGVRDAFQARREAVNLKKVALHAQWRAEALERKLLRLALICSVGDTSMHPCDAATARVYFYPPEPAADTATDTTNPTTTTCLTNTAAAAAAAPTIPAVHTANATTTTTTTTTTLTAPAPKKKVGRQASGQELEDHLSAASALLRVRAVLAVATDARVFVKRACKLPRHPDAKLPKAKKVKGGITNAEDAAYSSSRVSKAVKKARQFVVTKVKEQQQQEKQQQQEQKDGGQGDCNGGASGSGDRASGGGAGQKGSVGDDTTVDDGGFWDLMIAIRSAKGGDGDGDEGGSILDLPWVGDYVEKVLIARGVYKAMAVRAAAQALSNEFAAAAKDAGELLRSMESMESPVPTTGGGDDETVAVAMEQAKKKKKKKEEKEVVFKPQAAAEAAAAAAGESVGAATAAEGLAGDGDVAAAAATAAAAAAAAGDHGGLVARQQRDLHKLLLEPLGEASWDVSQWLERVAGAKDGDGALFRQGDSFSSFSSNDDGGGGSSGNDRGNTDGAGGGNDDGSEGGSLLGLKTRTTKAAFSSPPHTNQDQGQAADVATKSTSKAPKTSKVPQGFSLHRLLHAATATEQEVSARRVWVSAPIAVPTARATSATSSSLTSSALLPLASSLPCMAGRFPCVGCRGSFSRAFIERGLCFQCEWLARQGQSGGGGGGACPYSSFEGSLDVGSANKKTKNSDASAIKLTTKAAVTTASATRLRSCCPPSLWCPHQRVCGGCERLLDGKGCGLCRFYQADDGEEVAMLLWGDGQDGDDDEDDDGSKHDPGSGGNGGGGGLDSKVAPVAADVLFLDFDQTLCSTKSGGAPDPNKHRADPDLVALVQARLATDQKRREQREKKEEEEKEGGQLLLPPPPPPSPPPALQPLRPWSSVYVVTRNSNTAAIQLFLARHGCGGVPVVAVGGGRRHRNNKKSSRKGDGSSRGDNGSSSTAANTIATTIPASAATPAVVGAAPPPPAPTPLFWRDKADFILSVLGDCSERGCGYQSGAGRGRVDGGGGGSGVLRTGMFVDDSLAEISDLRLASCPRLTRVLFGCCGSS